MKYVRDERRSAKEKKPARLPYSSLAVTKRSAAIPRKEKQKALVEKAVGAEGGVAKGDQENAERRVSEDEVSVREGTARHELAHGEVTVLVIEEIGKAKVSLERDERENESGRCANERTLARFDRWGACLFHR